MNDDQIIELIKDNNSQKAFIVLYKHFPMIRKMIMTKGGSKDDAQDIFQEALIVFYNKAKDENFKLTSQLSTYLYSVSNYLWKDELRKREKAMTYKVEQQMGDKEDDLFIELEKEEEIKLAERIINELGDRCRELLILFYSGTMKLKEIGVKMGYNSENTVKTQKYKCLEMAKSKLREMKKQNQPV